MNNDLLLIPLNKLVRSSLNVRKTGADSIEDLAASHSCARSSPEPDRDKETHANESQG